MPRMCSRIAMMAVAGLTLSGVLGVSTALWAQSGMNTFYLTQPISPGVAAAEPVQVVDEVAQPYPVGSNLVAARTATPVVVGDLSTDYRFVEDEKRWHKLMDADARRWQAQYDHEIAQESRRSEPVGDNVEAIAPVDALPEKDPVQTTLETDKSAVPATSESSS